MARTERTEGPALVAWAVAKLALDFPASFGDVVTTQARDLGFRELLAAHPWITAPVFERAVYLVRWKHEGPFIPQPARFLEYCEAAAQDLEQQRRAQQRRLPAPAPPTAQERLEAEARTAAAKGAARAMLPAAMRKRSPLRGESARRPPPQGGVP